MEILNTLNLSQIQIDITSYCNSFCGSCIRNINGGPLNPAVKLEHMSWKVWKHIVEFCKNNSVDRLSFNGNYGDISSHPEIIEMFEYLYLEKPATSLNIHTNGGARNVEFWKDLATITKNFPSSHVTFSIDGLKDTNHIYRRGVSFDRIIENASAFISSGGNAVWRMIVFDHNKHQLKQASDFAKEIGFCSFTLNRSFRTQINVDKYKEFPKTIVTAPTTDIVNQLRSNVEYRNEIPIVEHNVEPLSKMKRLDSRCPWQQDRSIQVNMIGEVWPCCYLNMYSGNLKHDRFKVIKEKKQQYGENFNNLNYFTLTEILDHPFFQQDLPKSFENNPLIICKEKCNL